MCSEVLCETLRKPSRSASQIKDSRDFQSNHVRSNDLHPLREKRRAVISCTVVIFRNAGFVVIHLIFGLLQVGSIQRAVALGVLQSVRQDRIKTRRGCGIRVQRDPGVSLLLLLYIFNPLQILSNRKRWVVGRIGHHISRRADAEVGC